MSQESSERTLVLPNVDGMSDTELKHCLAETQFQVDLLVAIQIRVRAEVRRRRKAVKDEYKADGFQKPLRDSTLKH